VQRGAVYGLGRSSRIAVVSLSAAMTLSTSRIAGGTVVSRFAASGRYLPVRAKGTHHIPPCKRASSRSGRPSARADGRLGAALRAEKSAPAPSGVEHEPELACLIVPNNERAHLRLFRGELDCRSAAHLLTRDEARRIAAKHRQAAGDAAKGLNCGSARPAGDTVGNFVDCCWWGMSVGGRPSRTRSRAVTARVLPGVN
jgi:hypothetical protein